GDVYLDLNLIPEALEAYERALPVLREFRAGVEIARAEAGLARALSADGRDLDAAAALDRAGAAFRSEGNQLGAACVRLQQVQQRRLAGAAAGGGPDAHLRRQAQAAGRLFRRAGVRARELEARLELALLRVD